MVEHGAEETVVGDDVGRHFLEQRDSEGKAGVAAEAGDELVVGDVVGDAARQDHDAEDPGCLVGEVDVGEVADEVNTAGEVGELA